MRPMDTVSFALRSCRPYRHWYFGRARVGLAYRTIRAAGAAVLIAAAVGAGGMTGMTSALAADPATVALSGIVHDVTGAAFADIELVITEELTDDGGLAAFHATTGSDGAFS